MFSNLLESIFYRFLEIFSIKNIRKIRQLKEEINRTNKKRWTAVECDAHPNRNKYFTTQNQYDCTNQLANPICWKLKKPLDNWTKEKNFLVFFRTKTRCCCTKILFNRAKWTDKCSKCVSDKKHFKIKRKL